MADAAQQILEQVAVARAARQTLRIVGSGSKTHLQSVQADRLLLTAQHSGILNYEPTELVITARSGTTLGELEAVLAQHNQMLPFEPPSFAPTATLGGTLALGLSGPRRPFVGAARDAVLGIEMINGFAERLNFGGQVMKNVAGFDVSRLQVGARGALGVLLAASLKVLPRPTQETTLRIRGKGDELDAKVLQWCGQPLPISATVRIGEELWMRLSGSAAAIEETRRIFEGEAIADADSFWHSLREHRHEFFMIGASEAQELWRFSLPPAAPPLKLAGQWLVEWGGSQRWLRCEALFPEQAFAAAAALGGHASRWLPQYCAQPLPPVLRSLHGRLKQAFDPDALFNPGVMEVS